MYFIEKTIIENNTVNQINDLENKKDKNLFFIGKYDLKEAYKMIRCSINLFGRSNFLFSTKLLTDAPGRLITDSLGPPSAKTFTFECEEGKIYICSLIFDLEDFWRHFRNYEKVNKDKNTELPSGLTFERINHIISLFPKSIKPAVLELFSSEKLVFYGSSIKDNSFEDIDIIIKTKSLEEKISILNLLKRNSKFTKRFNIVDRFIFISPYGRFNTSVFNLDVTFIPEYRDFADIVYSSDFDIDHLFFGTNGYIFDHGQIKSFNFLKKLSKIKICNFIKDDDKIYRYFFNNSDQDKKVQIKKKTIKGYKVQNIDNI
jgi:hypothetical protein